MKKTLSLLLLCALLLGLCACTDPVIGEAPTQAPGQETAAAAAPDSSPIIELQGDSIRYQGKGAAVSGSVITIGAPGDYTVRGTLSDGRILIDTKEIPGKVNLYLDGADITCLTDSAICLLQADELNLILTEGSRNRVVSGAESDRAAFNELSSGAAIFAEDDLDIQGTGALEIVGNLNNGITCKDDLKLKGGVLTVDAVHNGIRASESVTVSGGEISVTAGNDGVKTSSANKANKGFILIEGGKLTVHAGGDGVAAETELTVTGGELMISTQGDPALASCKGLKGKTGVRIEGGSIAVDAADHAVRSGAGLTVSGGALALLSAQGKGLSAETELLVEAGALAVSAADDGLSCADTVRITGGELQIEAGADGIQGGKKTTGFTAAAGTVSIEGGRVLVSAFNKPIDAKASLRISGGTVFACGKGRLQPESQLPWLLFAVEGHAGAALAVDGLEDTLQSAYAFSTVFYASAALTEGTSYTLSGAARSAEAAAVR